MGSNPILNGALFPVTKRKVRNPQRRVSVRVPPALPPTPTPAQDGNALKGMGTHLVKMRTANQLRMSALKAEDQGNLPAHLEKKTPTANNLSGTVSKTEKRRLVIPKRRAQQIDVC